jgi:hypothetical protein
MPADGRDPSGYVTAPPSVVVKVTATARNDINGLLGIVISYNLERERYLVHMTKSQSTMALKKENLAKANMIESYRAQLQQLRNDDRVKEKMSKYLNLCSQYVAPMKLSHVVGSVLAVLVSLLYLVGFTKTVMTTSLLLLIGIIAGPDLMNRSPPQLVLQNFPERARSLMEKQMPILRGKLTNRMSVGVVLLLVAICLQSLFLTGGKVQQPLVPEAPLLERKSPSLERYYNMGYEDATEGREHGATLKEEQAAGMMPEEELPDVLELDELEGVGKKQTVLSKINNVSNIASIFYLYRSMTELGTDQSTNLFSIGQLAANLQHHTEWWRKILLALSLYTVVRIFL